jgi:hypothetical protein
MNTREKGSVRYIVFKEDTVWYAVGLEFNIVESAQEPTVALFNLFAAMEGYIEGFRKVGGARPECLNQVAIEEYETMWKNIHSAETIPSPYEISTYGVHSVS